MNKYEEYTTYLEENGIRASSQRILMLEYLQNNYIHPTADRIYLDLSNDLPTISKATVYNNLKLFLSKGIIKEVNFDNSEVHYDIVVDDHAHFVCKKCGLIEDLKINTLKIDRSSIDGFEIESQDIFLKGVCKACLEEEKNSKN